MSEDKNSRLDLTAQFEAEISEEDAGNFYMAREIKQEILLAQIRPKRENGDFVGMVLQL